MHGLADPPPGRHLAAAAPQARPVLQPRHRHARRTPPGRPMTAAPTVFTAELADRLLSFTAVAAAQAGVKAAVEANHDENRWWPACVSDWRMRMAVAGWSSRVSYTMIGTYAVVVK